MDPGLRKIFQSQAILDSSVLTDSPLKDQAGKDSILKSSRFKDDSHSKPVAAEQLKKALNKNKAVRTKKSLK